MRRPRWLLIVLAGWLAVPALALPEPGPDELERNRRLLERWKSDPEHYRRLLQDLRAFWDLPPERQEALRRLDRELHEADSSTQQRLWAVLERYRLWLERLPETDRERVLNAPDKEQRLRVIKEFRERQWVDRLPLRLRNELLTIDPDKRAARIADDRREGRQSRQLLQRLHPRLPAGSPPAPPAAGRQPAARVPDAGARLPPGEAPPRPHPGGGEGPGEARRPLARLPAPAAGAGPLAPPRHPRHEPARPA